MQDFLTSAFLVTGRDCFYTREAAAELMAAMCDALGAVDLPQPALLKPLQLWTGKQLMSALIRPSTRMQCAPRPVTRRHVSRQNDVSRAVERLRVIASACGAWSTAQLTGRCVMHRRILFG